MSDHFIGLDRVIQSEIEGEWGETPRGAIFTLVAVIEALCADASGVLKPSAELKQSALWQAAASTGWPKTCKRPIIKCAGFGFQILPSNPDDNQSLVLGFELKRWLVRCGFSEQMSMLIRDALHELHNNAIEHSQTNGRPLFGFAIHGDRVQFVLADFGIGALASLRSNPLYSSLRTSGAALKKAIEPGVSRFADIQRGRGYGFHDLLRLLTRQWGLAGLRSGNGMLLIDNTNDVSRVLSQSVSEIPGFQIHLSLGLAAPLKHLLKERS